VEDGEFVLTHRRLVFVGERTYDFPLPGIASFEVTAHRLHRRQARFHTEAGGPYRLSAARGFVDAVLGALGRPNAGDALADLRGTEATLARCVVRVVGTVPGLPSPERYRTGTYDALLTPTRLLGWAAPGHTLELALHDIAEWREPSGDPASVRMRFQDGTSRTLGIPDEAAATAIRRAADVRRKRLRG
jgi:hypothetical protein